MNVYTWSIPLIIAVMSIQLAHAQLTWSEKKSLGVNSCEVGVADVDRDGHVDILVAGSKQRWFAGPDFTTSYELGVSDGNPYAARTADLNADGWPDWITSDGARQEGDYPGELYVYLNPGSPEAAKETWQRITVYEGEVRHQNDMRIADMDGDGRLDIIERTWSSERVVVAMQNADISNWTVRVFDTGETGRPEGISAGDIDGDGEREIVLSGVYWDNPGGWRNGDPIEHIIDPTFVQEEVKSAVGDIDGDGDNDVYMGSAERGFVYLAWYEHMGKNEAGGIDFEKHLIKDDFGKCHMVELIDVDQDGDLDLCTGRSFGEDGCLIFYNNGNGGEWTEQNFDPSGGLYTGIVADLDGDGDLDVVGPDDFYQNGVHYYFNETPLDTTPTDSFFTLQVRIVLEGYMEGEQMRTTLNGLGLLPAEQPFSAAPWNYEGPEQAAAFPTEVSDWVLLRLRRASGAIVASQAVLLQQDGILLNTTLEEPIEFPVSPDSTYYLSVHHRGHLPVISNKALTHGEFFDFTTSITQAMGNEQLVLKAGKAAMICGDYDQNAIINNLDFNQWSQNPAAINTYLPTDGDGNGLLNNLDFNLWIGNGSKIGVELLGENP